MRAYQCDRCGRFYNYLSKGTKENIFITSSNTASASGNIKDLCGQCQRELEAWWTKKKEKEAENAESEEEMPSWIGKRCDDCGNEKCKSLGKIPRGYDCALWQEKKNGLAEEEKNET